MLRALDAKTAFRNTSQMLSGTGDQWKAHLSLLELISDLSSKGGGLELNWEEALGSSDVHVI